MSLQEEVINSNVKEGQYHEELQPITEVAEEDFFIQNPQTIDVDSMEYEKNVENLRQYILEKYVGLMNFEISSLNNCRHLEGLVANLHRTSATLVESMDLNPQAEALKYIKKSLYPSKTLYWYIRTFTS